MESNPTEDVELATKTIRDADVPAEKPPSPPPGASDSEIIDIPLPPEALNASFSLSDTLTAFGIHSHPSLPHDARRFQSPFDWSARRKITVLVGPFIASTLAAYVSGAYAMPSETLMSLWSLSPTLFNVGMTLFVAGFAVTPMILAPFSENHGRYWVFVGSGMVFFLGTMGLAVTASFAGMAVSRFIQGCGASVFATLTAGVVSDMYNKEERNTPMTLYSLTVLVGCGLGPLVSGVVDDELGWRWVFYLQMIMVGLTTLEMALFFQETRGNVILARKCRSLNKALTSTSSHPSSIPQIRFYVQQETPKIRLSSIWRSFAFPLRLLFTESVVFWFSAWASFAWAILYMQFNSISIVFKTTYNFSGTQVGAVYASVIVGSLLVAGVGIPVEPMLHRVLPRRMATPEGRLFPACFLSPFLPIGLFWFGWSANEDVHWIVPVLAIGACTAGIFSIYLAAFSYLADTYHRYASSALAAQSMCRNLLAGAFPLFTHVMWRNLEYGVAGSILGALALLLTGVPWLLSIFGPKVRARSPFAKELKGGDSETE